MLVSFSVENFKSFAKKETLSMVLATKIKKNILTNNFFKTGNKTYDNLLKIACFYGANASGKTKFIEAIYSFLFFFKEELQEVDDNFEDIYEPFAFNKDNLNKPTTFSLEFIVKNVLYSYLISYNKNSIVKEKLIKFNKNKEEIIFSIEKDNIDKSIFSKDIEELSKNTILKIQKQNYNNSFLRLFDQDSTSDILTDILLFFKTKINVILCESRFDERIFAGNTAEKYIKNNSNDRQLITNILKTTCNSFTEININQIDVDLEKMKIPAGLKKLLQDEKKLKRLDIKFKHKNTELDIRDESSGTKIMFGLSGRLIDLFRNGGVIFIDELDKNLHPDILVYLIKLFQNKNINISNAQLVFTIHNDIILDQFYDEILEKRVSLLRRDQVYFINKDRNEASHLNRAVDYTGTQFRDNMVKLYRNGFFASRPFDLEESYIFLEETIHNDK